MAAGRELTITMAERKTPTTKPKAAAAKPKAKATPAAKPKAKAKAAAKPKPKAARKPADRRSKRTSAARSDAEAARDVALFDNFGAIRDLPLEEWPDGRATGLQGTLDFAEGMVDAKAGAGRPWWIYAVMLALVLGTVEWWTWPTPSPAMSSTSTTQISDFRTTRPRGRRRSSARRARTTRRRLRAGRAVPLGA